MSSSIYDIVVFDLTFLNEVTKSDNILKNIEANVIDSCIEVIIGLPDIRSHRLVHRIPSYFDSTDPTYLVPPQGHSQASTPPTIALLVRDTKATYRALCKGSMPCNNCAFLIARGHDNTLCSLVGRPNTLQCMGTFAHRMFTDNELIKKKVIFDPIEDDIDWKYNPFDVNSIDEMIETPEQLMSQITFEGSPPLQTKLKALVLEFIDVFVNLQQSNQ